MIAIVISIAVSLSILLSAFVSFSPNFKSLVEEAFKRKAQENAWSYSAKIGQLIARSDSQANPPTGWSCTTNTIGGNTTHNCKETIKLRSEEDAMGAVSSSGHICAEITITTGNITVNKVAPSKGTCP